MPRFTAVLAASLPLSTQGLAQVLPAGEFSARDGRPGPGKTWRLSDADGTALAAKLNSRATVQPLLFDYEHQTVLSRGNGQPAPAAGWGRRVEWRKGEGMFSEVAWTPKAKGHIDALEYQYTSPVIEYDQQGRVTDLLMVALTNHPALMGMSPVQAALSAQFQQEPSMNKLLAALCAALNLKVDATDEDQAVAALNAHVADHKKNVADLAALVVKPALPAALCTALGLQATADEAAALTAVTTLKTSQTDAGLLQLVTTLQGQVTELTARQNEDAVAKAVDAAIAAGKLIPAQRDVYLGIGRKDMATLTTIIGAAVPVAGLNGQTGGLDRSGGNTAALTADAAKLLKGFGLSQAEFDKAAQA